MDSKEAGERLRKAIESGNFEQAPALAAEYGEAVRCEIEAADNSEHRAAIANQARMFLQDRLHLAHVMQAHLAAQLRTTTGVASYQSISTSASSWQIDG